MNIRRHFPEVKFFKKSTHELKTQPESICAFDKSNLLAYATSSNIILLNLKTSKVTSLNLKNSSEILSLKFTEIGLLIAQSKNEIFFYDVEIEKQRQFKPLKFKEKVVNYEADLKRVRIAVVVESGKVWLFSYKNQNWKSELVMTDNHVQNLVLEFSTLVVVSKQKYLTSK